MDSLSSHDVRKQLDKIDAYYLKESQKNLPSQGSQNLLPTSSNVVIEPPPSKTEAVGWFNQNKGLSSFGDGKWGKWSKRKWDKYQPCAFNKLGQNQRDEMFRQLFVDYLQIKIKLNEEIDSNKKMQSRNNYLEHQLSKSKSKSPEIFKNETHKRSNDCSKENQQLKEEVKRLHQKIYALAGNKQKIGHKPARPQSAVKNQKNIFPSNENIKAELELQRKQVKELLLIIDDLKAVKFSLENQLKEKQANQSVSRGGNRSMVANNQNNQNESQFQSYAFDLEKWKQKYNNLELQYNKMSEDKDRRIKVLQVENIQLKETDRMKKNINNFGKINEMNTKHLEEKVEELQRQKESLEKQVRKLVNLPFNQNAGNKNQADIQEKNIKLEQALEKLNTQFKKVKEERSKFLADLEFKTREGNVLKNDNEKLKKQLKELLHKETNIKEGTEIDYNDYYRKLLGLVKLEGDDPVWRKYANLATPSFNTMTESQLRKEAEALWLSKLELMAHLQKLQIELNTINQSTEARIGLYLKDKENMEEELRAARARLDEWVSMDRVGVNRHVQLYEWNGIRYDDSVSVFEANQEEMKELGQEENYFDLFMGQLSLDETSLLRNPNNKIKQMNKMVSFVTVDFYNHDTQHSNFVEGNSRKLTNNFSFKVEMNQYTVKFLAKKSVVLELWSPQGSSTVLLGKGEIWLRDLVANSVKDVSAVVRGKCPFYSQSDSSLVATLQYRIRMRLPIAGYCEWSSEQFKVGKAVDMFKLNQRKRLQVKIIQAINLPTSSAHFVHFSLQGDNFNTAPVRGSSPEWNFRKEIELIMDQQLQSQFKQKYLELVVFDDEEQVNDDVVGIARASLTKMIDTAQQLSLDLDIRDDQYQLKGKLKVEFKWV